jgi:excinuclease ABC subunit A
MPDVFSDLSYRLLPVGMLYNACECLFLSIHPDFRPALKHLDAFSHLILFAEPGISPFFKTPGTGYDVLFEQPFRLFVKRILRIDEESGVVLLEGLPIEKNLLIYDVKPYFPCEDRVQTVKLPENFANTEFWIPEAKNTVVLDQLVPEIPKYPSGIHDVPYVIKPMGFFDKGNGVCRIVLNGDQQEVLSRLSGFSHIKIGWWFHRFDKKDYRKITLCDPPYENAPRTGVFACRSPVRPNPIALTTTRIRDIRSDNCIDITSTDAFDRSPIIFILPYVPSLDRVKDCFVPECISHWPQWLDDTQEGTDVKVTSELSPREKLLAFCDKPEYGKNDLSFPTNTPYDDNRNRKNDIIVIGARQNNLKNITCVLPKNQLTVVTGISGSGKSSFAFDTVFAESRRRFMEGLASQGGAFSEQIEKPDIDSITGLPPAIAVEQKNIGRNPRSTVGTFTGLYDYLRTLYTVIGVRYCPECGKPVEPLKAEEIRRYLLSLRTDTVFEIRAYRSSDTFAYFQVPPEATAKAEAYKARLEKVIHESLVSGNGAIEIKLESQEHFLLQTKEMCMHCQRFFFERRPSLFSFNNPDAMCPDCKGLGVSMAIDPERIVAFPHLSVLNGASAWWGELGKFRKNPNANWFKGEVLALADKMGVDLERPWKDLPDDFKRKALYGSEEEVFTFYYENKNGRKGEITRPVEGAYNAIRRLLKENKDETVRRLTEHFVSERPCPSCGGERLKAEARAFKIGKTRFPETVSLSLENLLHWIDGLQECVDYEKRTMLFSILKPFREKLSVFIEAGLSYLTLDRPIPTLSGGELQRLRLASMLNSGITNVLYVLDEPTSSLHPKDRTRLLRLFDKLKKEGNTILLVEHDLECIRVADKVIDLGPGAGVHGGYVIAEGTPDNISLNPCSITGKFLSQHQEGVSRRASERKIPTGYMTLSGAKCHNLKNITIRFPLGVFCCITGVSGSGKSSLITQTLFPLLCNTLTGKDLKVGEYASIEGYEAINDIVCVSQQPIGRTPRSNPATYTGMFDDIREMYASTEEAKRNGFRPGHFSFNSKDGQCSVCNGEGRIQIDMYFMPDLWVECPECHGKRFKPEILQIKRNGKNIADILDMTTEEAVAFFGNEEKPARVLQLLNEVGLSYLKLGQSALTLSGGEAQRIKLAKELSKPSTGKTLYLLDEPTAGLHASDILHLVSILKRLTEAGNTVIIIEHSPEMILCSDWVIDLGPQGGDKGGFLVAEGTPEHVSTVEDSPTGQVLKNRFRN